MIEKTNLRTAASMLCAAMCFAAVESRAAGQWDAGMEDESGEAKATSITNIPGTSFAQMRHIYPQRDRLQVTSLDGTWAFKLLDGLVVPPGLDGWNKPGFDVSQWDVIDVPGNWETQGFKRPQYGNQIDEMTGLYVRRFRTNPAWRGKRVILRFDGVLFGYEAYVNGAKVGEWGSAYNLSQWDVTPYLNAEGYNTIAVKVITRSRAWLFDTNDCFCIAGIQRSVELFTVPETYLEDVTFRTTSLSESKAEVSVRVDVGSFAQDKDATQGKLYVSLVDPDTGLHAIDFVRDLADGPRFDMSGTVANPKPWSAESPFLYNLVVTLTGADGIKTQRVVEKTGIRTVAVDGLDILVNGRKVFLKGVAWNEIDPALGRAITPEARREAIAAMKRAGVNAIRTAHYPFGPDFTRIADETGVYVIDEVPFGSRGSMLLKNRAYLDELIARTEATLRRDKNAPSVIVWTFGNENTFTPNTKDVLAYALEKDPTRPRALPQIGSSQFQETLAHPERPVEINAGHYLSIDRMRDAEARTTKPMLQTEFAHSCGNGFNDFERAYLRMLEHQDKWSGGCVWVWADQSVAQNPAELAGEFCASPSDKPEVPRDARRALPRELNGNFAFPDVLLDSWGDRGTDGVVYADGTPKDAYWLLKQLYTKGVAAKDEQTGAEREAIVNAHLLPEPQGAMLAAPPKLRVGRKVGLDCAIQNMRKKKPYWHQPYLLEPEVTATKELGGGAVRWDVRYTLAEGGTFEGWVSSSADGTVAYNLAHDEKAGNAQYLELGLAVEAPEGTDRIDWLGDGILTTVPNRSMMNKFGFWAMHADDYRLEGPRANVHYALAGTNHSPVAFALVSGTGKVGFEKTETGVYLTELVAVAGYGGKSVGPSGIAAAKDMPKMCGSFTVGTVTLPAPLPDVAPDTPFTRHYGF